MTAGPLDIVRGTCGTCKHFDRLPASGQDLIQHSGVCRHSPPQVSVIVVPVQNQITGQMGMSAQTACNFPPTDDKQWCGQWTGRLMM